jgi:large subunit ribosomal protein L4
MKLEVYSTSGTPTGRTIELPETVFGIAPNEHCMYLAVKQYLAHQRQGTSKSKERSEISGSTRKLIRQKGTGGARRGDINNPLYPGGGRVFGPRPRTYTVRLTKQVRTLARKSALSTQFAAGKIRIVEDFTLDAPKTSAFVTILKQMELTKSKTLLVFGEYTPNVYLSLRNLPKADMTIARDLNTYQILNAQTILLSESSVASLSEVFA